MQALQKILFIDIETVSASPSFDQMPERLKPLWQHKSTFISEEGTSVESSYFDRAAIYAEFGKIIVIGLGFFYQENNKDWCFRSKSIQGDNEKELLIEFTDLLKTRFKGANQLLCAHNGKEFDFPYLCRRMVINQLTLPKILDISLKKPWEIPHLDTLEMWKFGDKKAYTSLDLLTAVLDVPTSKGELDGSKVNTTYYKENDINKIAAYCKRDVVATAQVYLRLIGMNILPDENIFIV